MKSQPHSFRLLALAASGIVAICSAQQDSRRQGCGQAIHRIQLPRLSRQDNEDGWAGLDGLLEVGHRPESGGLGKGRPQADRAADAAEGCAAAGRAEYDAAVAWLESSLDACRRQPSESRAHRDVPAAQPHGVSERHSRSAGAGGRCRRRSCRPDESSHGFDNITVADLSPTLLNRYVSAAQKISRLAVGTAPPNAAAKTSSGFGPTSRRTSHIEGLPLGTRGGAADRVQLSAGRRVRDSGPADARPQ